MTQTATKTAFEALLGDLQLMAKAIDVNQERIDAGRAAEGHMQSGEAMTKSDKERAEKKKKEEEEEERRKKAKGGGEEHMQKSFSIQAADGSTIEVQDASELIKALSGRLDETTQTVFQTLESATSVIKAQGALIKSMTDKIAAQETLLGAQTTKIDEQATLVKSLRTDLDKFGSSGSGRRAVVTVAERTAAPATETMAKGGMPEGVTTETFFAKAMDLQKAGRLTGADIALAEAALNSGIAVPAGIVQRVLGDQAAH